jgi:hypothetical protein
MAKQIPEEATDKVVVEAITKMLKEMEERPEEKRGTYYWGPLYGHDSLTKETDGRRLTVYSSQESIMDVLVCVEGTGGYNAMKQLSPGENANFSPSGSNIRSLKVDGVGPGNVFYAWGRYIADGNIVPKG